MSVQANLVYGKGGDIDLTCDVYRPDPSKNNRTAIIQIHGGGFRRGSKDWMDHACEMFTAHGYVAVAMRYRLADEAKWPAQIHDVKACIRWLRANASTYDIEPDNIAVVGHSVGAHLSLVAASTAGMPEFEGDGGNPGVSSAVAACIAYYPPINVQMRAGEEPAVMPSGSSEEDYRRASPITYMNAGCSPVCLFHGTSDGVINHDISLQVFHALQGAGVPVEMHLFEGLSHEFDELHSEFGRPCAELAHLFLDRHVVNPRTYPPFSGEALAALHSGGAQKT